MTHEISELCQRRALMHLRGDLLREGLGEGEQLLLLLGEHLRLVQPQAHLGRGEHDLGCDGIGTNAPILLSGCVLRRCGASQFFDRCDKLALFLAIGPAIRVGRILHSSQSQQSGTAFFNDKTILFKETSFPSLEIFFEASESLVGSTEGDQAPHRHVVRGHQRDHI